MRVLLKKYSLIKDKKMKKGIGFISFLCFILFIQTPVFSTTGGFNREEKTSGFKDPFKDSNFGKANNPPVGSGAENDDPIGDGGQNEGSPVGDALYILLLAAAGYGIYLYRREKRKQSVPC
jgi:hypothetical protein